eukprot:8397562-Alexandrium_andersonii.AAC.1
MQQLLGSLETLRRGKAPPAGTRSLFGLPRPQCFHDAESASLPRRPSCRCTHYIVSLGSLGLEPLRLWDLCLCPGDVQ